MKSISNSLKKHIPQLSSRQKVVISVAALSLIIVILIVQFQVGLRGSFKREANNFLVPFKEIMTDIWPIYNLPQTDEAYNYLVQMKDSLERLRKTSRTKEEKQLLAVCEDIYKKLLDLYRDAETPELDGISFYRQSPRMPKER